MSDRKSSYKLVCDSPRLRIRELTLDDTAFIIERLNQDSFIRNIGDKKLLAKSSSHKVFHQSQLKLIEHHQ